MQRSPIVIAATIAGTAGVLAFHPHAASQTATASTASTTRTATATTTPSGSSGSGSPSGASGTATGDAVDTHYGSAQVRVTVKNGKITNIEALQLQGNDPRSLQISSSAEPILKQEVLTTQSADIDAVSGATYTSG